MRECDGCRFCCWSFNAHDIPNPVTGFEMKPARQHCVFECDKGCELHATERLPQACDEFKCPYLQGQDIHRPDTFQEALEELGGNIGNYIPAVPESVPVSLARTLIREDRSVPAFILLGNEWARVILPLDRNEDRTWTARESAIELWGKFLDVELLPAGLAAP